jgi:hypothetical protein
VISVPRLISFARLRKLDVSNTLLGDDGINSLFNLVKGTTSLNSLNVSYCGINSLREFVLLFSRNIYIAPY